VRRAVGVTPDTSVWVPYLRSKRYASAVDPLVGAGRVWVHGIALLELYAGTASVDDARAVDTLREAARSLGRLYVPPDTISSSRAGFSPTTPGATVGSGRATTATIF